jgi:hypothetical protein
MMYGDDYSATDAAKDLASATGPYGRLAVFALNKRKQIGKLASLAKGLFKRSPKLANAAHMLAKAKAGDKEAQAQIMAAHQMAQQGHAGAKSAVNRMKLLNQHTSHSRPVMAMNETYDRGIT